jgi:chromosome segregation ATPase
MKSRAIILLLTLASFVPCLLANGQSDRAEILYRRLKALPHDGARLERVEKLFRALLNEDFEDAPKYFRTAVRKIEDETPGEEAQNLSDLLLSFYQWEYAHHASELEEARTRLNSIREHYQILSRKLERLWAQYESIKVETDAENKAAEMERVEAQMRDIERQVSSLQNEQQSLSDQIKSKNLMLQNFFDILTQVQSALHKIITSTATKIGR